MNSLDILYYSLAIGFIILVGFLSYASFRAGQALGRAKSLIEKADSLAGALEFAKDKLKIGALGILIRILSKFLKK